MTTLTRTADKTGDAVHADAPLLLDAGVSPEAVARVPGQFWQDLAAAMTVRLMDATWEASRP